MPKVRTNSSMKLLGVVDIIMVIFHFQNHHGGPPWWEVWVL